MANNVFKEFPARECFKATGNKTLDILKDNIDRLERERLEYAVWGGAQTWLTTKKTIEDYTGKPSKEKYIIDNNKLICDGIHRLTPAQFIPHMSEIDTVFICVYVADMVMEQLMEMGYNGNVIPMVCAPWAGETFIDGEMQYYDDYRQLFDMLADEWSKQTLVNWLMAGASGDISLYSKINGKSKYKLVEDDILHLTDKEHFVDVGAFTGDTIDAFLELTANRYNSIAAIEAEVGNYNELLSHTAGMPNVTCVNSAAGNKNGEVRFIGNMSECGRVSDEGDVVVPMLMLDSIEAAQNATFIKLSANGSEAPIVEGARELIVKNKPKLSYYCGGAQRWIIPRFLKDIVPEYKIYLRHYGYGIQGMVGYAICE